MCYLEEFLVQYYDHIEDYEALIYLLSLLPQSYQYIFLLNLLEQEGNMVEGDLYEGMALEGIIKIKHRQIIIEFESYDEVLLDLPPKWDL